jgi:hypothetical protein
MQDPDPDAGSEFRSISQKHGSQDPDPDTPQNVMDHQHWSEVWLRRILLHEIKQTFLFVAQIRGCYFHWLKGTPI